VLSKTLKIKDAGALMVAEAWRAKTWLLRGTVGVVMPDGGAGGQVEFWCGMVALECFSRLVGLCDP
jgi:hypothetical protein